MPTQDSATLRFVAPRPAYNMAAASYDGWDWQTFWRLNEVPLLLEAIGRLTNVRSILDVGIGTGYLAKCLSDLGYDVTGIDVSENMLAIARDRMGCDAKLIQGDAQRMPLFKTGFDVVLCTRVLSHIQDIEAALQGFYRALKPRGSLLISDIDAEHNYASTALPVGATSVVVETHKRSLDELEEAARSAGFDLACSHKLKAENLLWLPEDGNLSSIDRSGSRSVGYIALLAKAE